MPIAGSYRIHRHTLRSAHFVASRLSPSHRYRCTRSSSRSSPRLAGRIVVSLCRLSIRSHIRCGFDCLLTAAGSVVVVSSLRAVPSCVSCLPVGSSRLSPRLSSRRSGRFLRLAPSCDTMGGASAVAVRLRRAFVPHPDFLPPVSSPCACLHRVVPAL